MGVVALALGILGVVVLWWAGPAIGGFLAGAFFLSQSAHAAWPIWVLGIAIGVLPCLAAVAMGVSALKKDSKKGVALAGIVTGAIGAIGALITVIVMALALNAVDSPAPGAKAELDRAMKEPVSQQGLKQLMDQAGKQAGQRDSP